MQGEPIIGLANIEDISAVCGAGWLKLVLKPTPERKWILAYPESRDVSPYLVGTTQKKHSNPDVATSLDGYATRFLLTIQCRVISACHTNLAKVRGSLTAAIDSMFLPLYDASALLRAK